MPTMIRSEGFRVLILLPPREHGPAHVHVVKDDGLIVIELARPGHPQRTLRIEGKMKRSEVRKAEDIVYAFRDGLLSKWREIHGTD